MIPLLILVDRRFPCDHAFIEEVMTKELSNLNYDVFFFMRTNDKRINRERLIKWNEAKVLLTSGDSYSNLLNSVRNVFGQFYTFSSLRTLVNKHSIKCILVRNDPIMGLAACWLAYTHNLPLIFQISHLKEEELLHYTKKKVLPHTIMSKLKGYVGVFLRKIIISQCDYLLPVSETMLNYFKDKGVSASKMIALPLGANVETIADPIAHKRLVRNRLGLDSDARILIYIGTMSRVRRLEIMIEAFAKVLCQCQNTYLLMLGGDANPGDTEFLVSAAKCSGIVDHVIFLGKVPRTEVSFYVTGSDIGLSPFPDSWILRMNSPMKLMEYLGCGIPVVATRTPEQEIIINGSKAGVCVDYEVHSYEQGMLGLLNKNQQELIKLGKQGAKYIAANRSYRSLARILDKSISSARNQKKNSLFGN